MEGETENVALTLLVGEAVGVWVAVCVGVRVELKLKLGVGEAVSE